MNLPNVLEEIFAGESESSVNASFDSASIEATNERHAEPATALAAFLELPGAGWLTTVEGTEPYLLGIGADADPAPHEYPLSGEKSVDERTSVRLSRDGEGGWNLATLTETDSAPPEGNAPGPIVRNEAHVSNHPKVGKLRYRVCFAPRGDSPVVEPVSARFTGFGDA